MFFSLILYLWPSCNYCAPFIRTVEIGGIQYIGAAARTKKEAQIKVARTALLAIQGIFLYSLRGIHCANILVFFRCWLEAGLQMGNV
jgi:hypothetical protein